MLCFIFFLGKRWIDRTIARTRFTAFSRRAASGTVSLQSFPPTEGAEKQHSLRTYLPLCDWVTLNCMHLDPLKYGWKLTEYGFEPNPSLNPIAPQELLELTHCNCTTNCNNRRCYCRKNGLKCISACGYCKGTSCHNSMTAVTHDFDDLDVKRC